MYRKIILALALDHGISRQALGVARALCDPGGAIIALHAYEPVSSSVRAYLDPKLVARAFADAEKKLAARVADAPDVEAVMLKGHAGRAIPDYARDIGADCIILGSHKPGLSDFLLGATASRIVRHAPCAVHVLRG